MRTFWAVAFICSLLLLGGCGEKETVTTTKSQPTPPTKPAVTEQVKNTADKVVKQATEMVETGKQLVKETATKAKHAVKEVVEKAEEGATAAAIAAKEKTAEVKNEIKKTGTELLGGVQTGPATSKTQNNGLLAGAAAATSAFVSPTKKADDIQLKEIIIIKNKKGDVTLPHASHGKKYGCSTCHGEGKPGPFELGKKTAHTLCKGCHKKEGGPTKCNSCHKK